MGDHGLALAQSLYPRVTDILRDMGLRQEYPDLPAVEWGRARGKAVHRAIELYEAGELEEADLHPEVVGPYRAYRSFKTDEGYVPEAWEEPICHPGLRYRGTLDSRGQLRGTRAVLDFKCSKNPDLQAAAYQLGAYALALAADGSALAPRYVVQLGEESYRVREVTSAEAATTFAAAVVVWWAQREKLTLNGGKR